MHSFPKKSVSKKRAPQKKASKTGDCGFACALAASAFLLVASLVGMAACGSGAGAGASCRTHESCADNLQCQNQICVPRCRSNSHCGDGYRCLDNGICQAVNSQIGDECLSEWDCGPGQACALDQEDVNQDERLASSCQVQGQGVVVGATCTQDEECRSGICAIGHCSQVCAENGDCPGTTSCQIIPRLLVDDSAHFLGCLPSQGVIRHELKMDSPSATVRIPVPSGAESFALVSQVSDLLHRVGATRLVAPSGTTLLDGEGTVEELENSPIRHFRQRRISTLFVPNSDRADLETGFYLADVQASLPILGTANQVPKLEVIYKMDNKKTLDLHFYFVDLAEHPCEHTFGGITLNAQNARESLLFQGNYLPELRRIIQNAGLENGFVTYTDIDRADLTSLEGEEREDLFRLADNESGIAIFFVRSMSPAGQQSQIGGIPGPPRTPGTPASGVAISVDSLCYRSWRDLARISAHSIAAQMGLFNNRDPNDISDPINDSDGSSDNLMFFGEFGGTELSEGQKAVLGRYPGLR